MVETILREELAAVGIRQASFSFDHPVGCDCCHMMRTSHWNDIMAKAKRLIQSGNVTLLRNGYNNVVAHVIGDHGDYQCEISRDDPNSRAITQWTCECPWDQYAFQRTRQWKKYEARPCAHVLAAYWKSLSTPLDEEFNPGPATPPSSQGPSGSPFAQQPGQEQGMMPGMGVTGQPPTPLAQPYDPAQMQNIAPVAPMAPPGQSGIIPPNPMDPANFQYPVSVPGGRPGPYPANPLQQGGTLSSINDQFVPGTSARMEEDTLGQSEGREGATDAGQWMDIPKNSVVEVVSQDPTTGWVEVLYPLRGGPMTSYHVRCFVEPEKLTPLPNQRSPFQPWAR